MHYLNNNKIIYRIIIIEERVHTYVLCIECIFRYKLNKNKRKNILLNNNEIKYKHAHRMNNKLIINACE